tara:strand:- start:308 stop:1135 length:828 start_codon:yes stop_codon:yes gene_type:complete
MRFKILLIFPFLLTISVSNSQNINSNIFKISTDSISSRNLLATFKRDSLVDIPKKQKKNFYFDKKTKKGFTKSNNGQRILYENFHYIKDVDKIDPYVRDVYWFNKKKKKIIKTKRITEDNFLLHGPYIKKIGDNIIEKGAYINGLKHGRWIRLNRSNILQDKEEYFLGWPKYSKKSFWDYSKKKLKEIIPIQYGEKDGYYYAFHKNGNLAVKGEYLFDQKIGVWSEYFTDKGKKKREISFPKEPFEENYLPVITKEWNINGKLIYNRQNFLKVIN